MVDAQKLLACFPEHSENMFVCESDEHLFIIKTDEDYDQDASRISLRMTAGRLVLQFLAVSHCYQGQGYCRKILTALFEMCLERGLPLNVEMACRPVVHVIESLVRNCSAIKHYEKIPPTEYEWLGPNLEINFFIAA